MNLQTLDISKEQAREALVHYRADLKGRLHSAEYQRIRKGYNRIVRGQQLIELSKVIAAGGADEKNRPRLAVMRADQATCYVRAFDNGRVEFAPSRLQHNTWRARALQLDFKRGTLPPWGTKSECAEGTSVVPLVPPHLLPAGHLSRYHILWEATWEDVPVDPALIQRIGGDLWTVLAVWNLTPLERAVLRGRSES